MALKSIGGAWIKHGKKGEFLSFKLNQPMEEGSTFMGFRITDKKNLKQPDWNLVVSVDDDTDDKPF